MSVSDDGYRILGPADIAEGHSERRDFGNEVLLGLSERPKHLPSRFFYDDRGSELFRQIMDCEEYYPTNCERQILERHAPQLASLFGGDEVEVIDLGAGDGAKTFILLDALSVTASSVTYRPIDISEGSMRTLVGAVRSRDIAIAGLVSEYADGLEWLASQPSSSHRLLLFLGSNIGNFDGAHGRAFLRRLWNSLRDGDHVLIGFDLKKDIDTLLSAYNDHDGLTAAFNVNLLERINRELGGHFRLESFRHYGTYDVFAGAMKSYLVSLEAQTVRIDALSHEFAFKAWEPVHTEYSYKYLRSDVHALAAATGYEILAEYLDDRSYFVDSLWRVVKSG